MALQDISFDSLTHYYPRRKPGDYHHFEYSAAVAGDDPAFVSSTAAADLAKGFNGIPGTPCCYQMSYALNMSGLPVDVRSQRRNNQSASILGKKWYFLLAVDEMEWFLDQNADAQEMKGPTTGPTSIADIKSALQDRYGILVCRKGNYGFHTEIWNGSNYWQRDIVDGILSIAPTVKFYDMSTGDN